MSYWHGKTVLVAGGAGFIGQHLVAALLDEGAKVLVVDDFSTGQELCFTTSRARGLNVIRQDISQASPPPTADIVFNLASPASPLRYQRDPLKTWKSNVMGTFNLLDHAMKCRAVLVQASTSEVYGDPLHHPQKETDWGNVNPIGPRACYDESKRAAETLLMDAWRISGADIRIARIFNTYGPGMSLDDGRAVPNFIKQAQTGAALTIYGDGAQTRSFCYVSDTVAGLLRLGSVAAAKGEVINIGNPIESTIVEIAAEINRCFGRENNLAFLPKAVDDPVRRRPDISKAKAVLGWEPKVKLRDGLNLTISAFEKTSAYA